MENCTFPSCVILLETGLLELRTGSLTHNSVCDLQCHQVTVGDFPGQLQICQLHAITVIKTINRVDRGQESNMK